MVERRVSDGVRIAQLLASEIEGHGGRLAGVTLADADPDVEPTADGAFAYAVQRDGRRIAAVYVHPERIRIAFRTAPDRAAAVASERGLRVRRTAETGESEGERGGEGDGRTLVLVEDGAEVKRALRTVEAVA